MYSKPKINEIKMRRFLTYLSFLLISIASPSLLHGDSPGYSYVLYTQRAQIKYKKIQKHLTSAVNLINNEGTKAFPKLRKLNANSKSPGLFVIDPDSGKLIVAPHEKATDKHAPLDNNKINGKSFARAAIKQARIKLYCPGDWEQELPSELYRNYFYKLALTLKGKIYIVAIGESNINMQRLFVTKLVNDACKILQNVDQEKAFRIFTQKDGLFKFKDTYIFVYDIKSDNEVICLYNPNYPKSVGKNLANLKTRSGYIVKSILEQLKKSDHGWVKSDTLLPGSTKTLAKDIYVKAVNMNGKRMAVGSGVYLKK